MIKAVIFDLDDTLTPEIMYVKSGFFEVAKKISRDFSIQFDECNRQLYTIFSTNTTNVFNRFFDSYGISIDDKYITELINMYHEHFPNISFYEDVVPTLEILKEKHYFLGLISDGILMSQNNKILALGARNYFEKIILTDELGREFWKPNAKAFELMAKHFNVRVDELVYIGDNPEKDFYITKTLHVYTIRIFREGSIHSNKKYFEGVVEKNTIRNLYELIDILEKINDEDSKNGI